MLGFHHLPLVRKLAFAFGLVALLTAALGAFAIRQIAVVNAGTWTSRTTGS
jgi:hypothetical protein